MAKGKDKDDEEQYDGVADGGGNPDDEYTSKEPDDSKTKGFDKGRADKSKEEYIDKDKDAGKEQDYGKKGKGYTK